MQQVMKILGFALLLGLLYVVVTGLGLTKALKKSKYLQKTEMINDFEYVRDDFDWATGGYVDMESSTENKTHGKTCAKVTFIPTNKFYQTPVPGVLPTNSSQVFYSTDGKATWRPQIILDTKSVTRLDVNEWQDYENFKMDVFNVQDQPVTFHIQVADAKTSVYETSGELTPKKVTNIVVPILDMTEDKRFDLSSIRSLRFWIEMSDVTQPVVLYLDYIRLDGDMKSAKKKESVPKPAPALKPTPVPGS